MIFVKNFLFILIIKISNKFGRAVFLKRKTFSSKYILERNFPEKGGFNFIQVGANDGVSFDFLYDFVIKRNSSGVVIEPIKEYFKELVINYKDFPKIIKINKAIHPIDKKIIIHRISPNTMDKYPDWVKGIASIDFEHHLKTGIDSRDIIQEIVEACNLMDIIKENLSKFQLDYFQIDTEGFDYEVVKMIDFGFIKPRIIKYESVNLNSEDKGKLMDLLKKQGYFLFQEFGDTIGVKLSEIKLY